jgi:transcription factor AP-2
VLSARLGGNGPGSHEHDPLSLHQALQNAVDEQNQVIDENATFMTDLPLLKSKLSHLGFPGFYLL